MTETITCLLVPALALVVLSALIVTSRTAYRSFGVGVLGVMGVIFGGPGAALLFGASSAESEPTPRALHEPIRTDELATANSHKSTKSRDARPAWVDEVPRREGGIHTQVVSSGPHVRIQDAYKALEQQLKDEANAYVNWYLDSESAARIIDLDPQFIRECLRNPDLQFGETRDYSVGPMRTIYARLDFDQSFRSELDTRWQDEVSKHRLWITALAGGGVFVLLLALFGYFRLDTATRGYYTGRLQFLTIAAILALIAAGVLAVKWIGIQWLV